MKTDYVTDNMIRSVCFVCFQSSLKQMLVLTITGLPCYLGFQVVVVMFRMKPGRR